ncbi:uncharacterized protein LOC109802021 [Cajanus cajan]|uniref:uncharacterized protein LOC109802021 n=1 Tax=Cajanus cajan TaxID=3821 RepID=UPI00098D7634|nr:uncharacterized protein LOC109802021 [Cajanus cajan]
MHSLKQTVDLLASLGSPVSVEDMTDHVLRGLDDGYRAVIDGVNARDTAILFDDLLEKLLIQEISLVVAQRQVPTPMTALNAQARPNSVWAIFCIIHFTPWQSQTVSWSLSVVQCQGSCSVSVSHLQTAAPCGATHHVTNDLANLALHHLYTGPDSLFMGNGSGYSADQHAYLCLNPTTGRIYTSRHVKTTKSVIEARAVAWEEAEKAKYMAKSVHTDY